jgi:tripartite-type tricarboxylate transporter receptor subunit TctC
MNRAMKTTLRVAGALILSLVAALAAAQPWPAKPVRLIVPYPPGGLTDVLARGVAAEVVKVWGQPLLVENRPGASQMIGAEAIAKSAPDGYTIGMLDKTPLAINPYLFSKLPYDPVRDFAPVLNLVQTSQVLVANPAFPADTVSQLIELAKSNPGSINYGSFGPGSITHLDTEAFAKLAGIKLTHIPYKGIAEVLPAVVAGQIQIAMSGVPPVIPLYRQARVKIIAAVSARRMPLLPEVPTLAEAGIDLVSASWFALFVAAGTPRPLIDRIARDIGGIISQRDFDERFVTGVGLELINQGPDQLAATIAADRAKYQAYVKNANLKLD